MCPELIVDQLEKSNEIKNYSIKNCVVKNNWVIKMDNCVKTE